jgi:hypothetical protein
VIINSIITLDTSDWWVKVLAMLQHNWALIKEHDDKTVTVYFFHDGGTTKNFTGHEYKSIRGMIAIVDSLDFPSREKALEELNLNQFHRLSDLPGPWRGNEPKGRIFDARHTEPLIYSRGDYWKYSTGAP